MKPSQHSRLAPHQGVLDGQWTGQRRKKLALASICFAGLVVSGFVCAQQASSINDAPEVSWFPIAASLAPNDNWAVVNFCNYYNRYYCRLVLWEPDGQAQKLKDGRMSTGKWTMLAGQEADKSYIWPAVSESGKKLAFITSDCKSKTQSVKTAEPYASTRLSNLECAFFNGQPMTSLSPQDVSVNQFTVPVRTAARPVWRPDEKAIMYWRSLPDVPLASGRVIKSRDIFEYDFETQIETPKHDRGGTGLYFGTEAFNPYYAKDSSSYSLCGFAFSYRQSIDFNPSIQCIETDATMRSNITPLNTTRNHPNVSWIYAVLDENNWIVSNAFDDKTQIYNKKSKEATHEIINRRLPNNQLNNYSPVNFSTNKNQKVLLISGTIFRSIEPIRNGSYYRRALAHAEPAAIFSLFDMKQNQLTAILWPDFQ